MEEPDRALVLDVPHDSRYADSAAAEIRVAVADDSRVAGRLCMWARRLVGEALSQANRFRRPSGSHSPR
ncbi:ferritin-like fold-containing protein [Micromonospora zamorensis]|uniref:ferritin-like fold-containing protein n=1 Tax=Micromonospora zamorensis TaxID=709883 RepID=UPI0033F74A7B